MAEVGWQELRVEVQGRPVFVRRGPEVPGSVPLVHVHGFAVSGSYLLPTATALAHRATTLVPDLPGYGQSAAWGHALGIPSLAWALLEVLDALDLERVVLVGNSMGGPVCLEVAHSAPERVAGVVLASPAGGMHNQPLARALVQLARDVRRESPRMVRVVLPDYLHFGPVNALQLFGELVRFPSLERILRTPVPTLAVIGTRDPLMPPPWRVQEVGRLAPPHLTIAVIEGAAHAMNFSHPGELAHVIGSWLDGREITDDPEEPGRRTCPGDPARRHVIPKLPQQPTLSDERSVVAADHRRPPRDPQLRDHVELPRSRNPATAADPARRVCWACRLVRRVRPEGMIRSSAWGRDCAWPSPRRFVRPSLFAVVDHPHSVLHLAIRGSVSAQVRWRVPAPEPPARPVRRGAAG